jgi:hypothetical protein
MLATTDKYQLFLKASTDLQRYVDACLLAKKAKGLSSGTLSKFYAPDLRRFVALGNQLTISGRSFLAESRPGG